MYPFTAHFYGTDVYLKNNAEFSNGEILCQILNLKTPDLKEIRKEIQMLLPLVLIPDSWSEERIENYDDYANEVQHWFHILDGIYSKLKLSHFVESNFNKNKRMTGEPDWLYLLNSASWIWYDADDVEYKGRFDLFGQENSESEEDEEEEPYSYRGEFEYSPDDDQADADKYYKRSYYYNDFKKDYLLHFLPSHAPDDPYPEDMQMDIDALNQKIEKLFDTYIRFLEDILRVQLVYARFLDEYINTERHFLTPDELAAAYIKFERDIMRYGSVGVPYLDFTSGSATFSHSVLEDKLGRKIFCETYYFESLGSFLYYDFFRGLEHHYIPHRCKNCGKYFLLRGGKYSEYCEGKAPQDNKKTCRDIGARQRYHDKCKNDPVWLIYNRAYKAHYARYMKKKMTVAEFERWSAYAIELRTKAEDEKLRLEEYRALIRK